MATVDSKPAPLHPIVGDRLIAGNGTSAQDWQAWQGLESLTRLDIPTHFSTHRRVCIFAPHPDDEILGCGGLLQALVAQGNQVLIVSVTQGEKSHPNSPLYPTDKLAKIRALESQLALETLGSSLDLPNMSMISLNFPDGEVFGRQADFFDKLTSLIQPADILITPFAYDGHPDHEGTGQVVQRFAHEFKSRLNLTCYQVLIWAWHWAKPGDSRIPWHKAWRFDLSELQAQRKSYAMRCFSSQIYADPTTATAPILSDTTLTRLSQPFEVYLHD